MTQRDRPEIEITEEMISAGADALENWQPDDGPSFDAHYAAEAVYRAMAPLARHPTQDDVLSVSPRSDEGQSDRGLGALRRGLAD